MMGSFLCYISNVVRDNISSVGNQIISLQRDLEHKRNPSFCDNYDIEE